MIAHSQIRKEIKRFLREGSELMRPWYHCSNSRHPEQKENVTGQKEPKQEDPRWRDILVVVDAASLMQRVWVCYPAFPKEQTHRRAFSKKYNTTIKAGKEENSKHMSSIPEHRLLPTVLRAVGCAQEREEGDRRPETELETEAAFPLLKVE